MITVLVCYERISLFHTMRPFFLKKYRRLFRFTQSADYCLRRDTNKALFMERQFQYRDPRDLRAADFDLMKKLREKYDTIVFFNGQPEAGPNRLDLLPSVDRFFDKSVFSDPANYLKDLYAKNLFADYYHRKYAVSDTPEYRFAKPLSPQDAGRVELSWNIGIAGYPRRDWPQRLGAALARADLPDIGRLFRTDFRKGPPDFAGDSRCIPVHARIDPVPCPSIAYQRLFFLQKIAQRNAASEKNGAQAQFLTGLTKQSQYYKELLGSKLALSPFGWGEVCHRDFEAIISGALLLKPDMSHIKTYPDVYLPYETYIPLDWDGADLFEKTDYYLANTKERARIAQNAFEQYQAELAKLENRFETLFQSLL